MQVVRHDDEFVQQIFPFVPVMGQGRDYKIGSLRTPEDGLALRRDRRDEEDAIGVHLGMVALWGYGGL